MSRPKQTTLDPQAFRRGAIGEQTAVHDEYFADDNVTALALILDHMVERLPDPERSAVQLVAMAGMSYESAASFIVPSNPPHRKTVWRWCRRGLLQIKEWLEATEWATVLTDGRIPLPFNEILLHPAGISEDEDDDPANGGA